MSILDEFSKRVRDIQHLLDVKKKYPEILPDFGENRSVSEVYYNTYGRSLSEDQSISENRTYEHRDAHKFNTSLIAQWGKSLTSIERGKPGSLTKQIEKYQGEI